MKNLFTAILVSLVCLSAGCAPDLGLRISPPDVPSLQEEKKVLNETKPLAGVKVKVAPFLDGRGSDALAIIDGEVVVVVVVDDDDDGCPDDDLVVDE